MVLHGVAWRLTKDQLIDLLGILTMSLARINLLAFKKFALAKPCWHEHVEQTTPKLGAEQTLDTPTALV
jgi:hypothetical protein